MNELRILSLEIQSMPKNPKVRFWSSLVRTLTAALAPSLLTTWQHLRQWWDEDWERTQDYFNSMLHRGGPAPHPLPGWL